MEGIIDDLKSIRQRQRQVKELESLLLELAAGTLGASTQGKEKVMDLLKRFQIENELSKSQEYLSGLKDQEVTLHDSYTSAAQEGLESRSIISLFKRMSGIAVHVISVDRDEEFDVEIAKYLVEFGTGKEGEATQEDQALGEMSDFRNLLTFEKKEFNLGLSKDCIDLQNRIAHKYISNTSSQE